MDQYVVSGMVMNRENLTNPVPVEPRAGAALTTTNAPATHCENSGGVCVRPCLGTVEYLWASKSEGLFIKIIYSVLCLLRGETASILAGQLVVEFGIGHGRVFLVRLRRIQSLGLPIGFHIINSVLRSICRVF